ncbi:hypothetical protein MMC30_000693 [Trapelia coarctata]|nr:hypothetical protein [Trapelia coarctata]
MDLELEPLYRPLSPGNTALPRIPRKPGKVSTTAYVNGDQMHTEPWRPPGLRLPYLAAFAVVSASLLAILLLISTASNTKNGLIQVDNPDMITGAQFFAYNYLPVIVAVIYSLLWQVVDSDARRYEPFPDLSRPGGIRGKELFFDYAYESSFIVPFIALRRKHAGVALCSLAFLLSSIVLGSLSSSLMGVTPISLSKVVSINTWESPTVAFDKQSDILNGEYLTQASSILLQNAALPEFTTSRYSQARQ